MVTDHESWSERTAVWLSAVMETQTPLLDTQSVLRLPTGAPWLASSRRDPHHAYTVGGSTWCVQFHPEFDAATTRAYLDLSGGELRGQGDHPVRLRESIAETPYAADLLRRFAAIAAARDPAA